MNQTIQLPLRIHFLLPTQCELVHALIDRDITKYRLNRTESSTVLSPSRTTINFNAHFIAIGDEFCAFIVFKPHLPTLFSWRFTHTLRS